MARCSVLVAEDDDDLRESLSLVLRSEGFRTQAAANGQQALALCRAQRPDVVLLDLHMPVMDGYEFLRQQSRDPQLAGVPVIGITGQPTEPLPSKVKATLKKPFLVEELLHLISRECR